VAEGLGIHLRSGQLSAVSFQLSAFSFQLSAFSFQLSAVSGQRSAFRSQLDCRIEQGKNRPLIADR
jgi:hypothetical protein